MALSQYSQDYDERYSLLAVTPISNVMTVAPNANIFCSYGWADALYPYVRSQDTYQCPTEGQDFDPNAPFLPTARGFTDYWLNTNLNGQNVKAFSSQEEISLIVAEDGNTGSDLTDARYNLPALPNSWLADKSSPSHRHLEGGNYLFMDGHVKLLTTDKVTNDPLKNELPTFAVK